MEYIRLHSWLSRLLDIFSTDEYEKSKISTQSLATENSLDRRRTARVQYPEFGNVETLPKIRFEGRPIKVQDISLGGICLIDSFDSLRSTVGNEIDLELVWTDGVAMQRSLIVAAGYDKRHLRFLDLDSKSFVRLNLLLKPGFLGLKMRKILAKDAAHLDIGTHEMWVGMTGEALTIFPGTDLNMPLAEVSIFGTRIFLYRHGAPVYCVKSKDTIPGQRIKESLLYDLLIFVSNIRSQSQGLKNLLVNLTEAIQEYQRLKE